MFVRMGAIVFGLMASGLCGAALAQSAPGGDAERGQSLYESTGCYECHGFIGQGGAPGQVIEIVVEVGNRMSDGSAFVASSEPDQTPSDTGPTTNR